MYHWIWMVGCSWADAAPVPVTLPQDRPPISEEPTNDPLIGPNTPLISLDLVDADIHGVLRLFGQWAKLNIVAGEDVSGKVTVQLHEVPWDQAFHVVLLSKGLAAVWLDSGAISIQPLSGPY